ncbi:hypothetical protein CYFUS_001742 [Cystobacter fuscus]|uniref:PNPLA domain-containing protein n=1 Tax=Cystobacter fuscus TaxID=43 RepID=A0A250IYK7_9BACT|nr:patatin-like phospholipase family protein [Cystobacter fuscus]ATB36328.1 hypothetical protein CYFUS_001742 [Cystobacter fuscus]
MDGSPAPLEDDASRLDRLLAHEGQYLDEARRLAQRDPSSDGASAPADPGITAPRRDLCGLALSGGGIRSATFNLGLLQCLQQMGLLEMFDYVSTVSGGGYIGGFWTAWRHYHLKEPSAGNTVALFPMSQEQGARGARFAEVRHLREFSNFLNPRLGLLSLDTGRMFVAALSAVLPSLLAAFSFLVLVLLLWLLLAWLLLLGWEGSPPWVARAVSYALMIGVTCGALFTWELLLFRQDNRVRLNRGRPGANPDEEVQEREGRRFGYYLNASVLAVGTVLFFWQWLVHAHPANAQAFHSVWWPVTEDAPPWPEMVSDDSSLLGLRR